jgi:hypothetical protein
MSGPGRPESEIIDDESDERIVISGWGLTAVFTRTGERWTHLLRAGITAAMDVALAVESDTECDSSSRVVSPVYQEVHRHKLTGDGRRCLLATGRTFEHHFSAAVSLGCDLNASGSTSVDFDVADRCRTPVESLAATYLVRLDGGALVGADQTRIAWDVSGENPGRLELLVDLPATLALAEAGRQAARVQVLAAVQLGGFTHRFRYRWSWTTVSDTT